MFLANLQFPHSKKPNINVSNINKDNIEKKIAVVFKKIFLNLNLKYYGGEELDFAYKMNKKFLNKIVACRSACVIRLAYPKFKDHCMRLIEFGETNFIRLPFTLQKNIIRNKKFLNRKSFILKKLIDIIYAVSITSYKTNIPYLNYYIIRMGMWSSILKGYYRYNKY